MRVALLLSILLLTFRAAAVEYQFSPEEFVEIQKLLAVKENSFSVDELNSLLKQISLKKDFTVAKINFNGNKVSLELKEMLGSQKLEVVGNQALTTGEILTLLNVSNTSRIDKQDVERNLTKVRSRYEAMGLKKVVVNLRENLVDGKVILIVEISEGSSTILEEIVVLSSNTLLNNAVKYELSSFLRQKIDPEMIKKMETITNQILLDRRILNAKIAKISPIYNKDRTSARMTITIESTSSYEFLFVGNKSFSSGNIIEFLNIEKNYLNYVKNQKLLQKNITELYRINGFPQTQVISESIYFDKTDKYVFRFKIKEGPQIRIKTVNFGGKISRTPSYYERLFFANLAELKNANLYVEENVQKAVDRLVLQLKDEGFLRAEKLSVESKVNRNATADISIQINENILTQIRNITFEGIENFTSNQLFDVIELKPNSPLNLVKVYNSYAQLKQFYQKNGYLEIDVQTPPDQLIKYVDNFEFADLTYKLHEGPQIKIKDIQTRGNDFTKDKVILRELDLKQGEVLSSETINDSVIFLERTQLFSRAQINTSDTNTNIPDRTVFVDVVEKNPGLFSSGIGLSNERNITLRGYLGLTYRNLAGTGRGLSGRVDAKYSIDKDIQYPENRIVLGYYEPYLFYNRLRGRISAIREQLVYELTRVDKHLIIQENNEVNFLLEKQFSRRFKFIWHFWDFSNLKIFNRDTDEVTSQVNIASIGPALEWDRRDDFFVPRDGTFSVAQIEWAKPFLGSSSDANNYIDFLRFTAGHTVYTPLTPSKKWVVVNDFRTGLIENLSNKPQSGIPSTRLFYLGGRSTLRGYDLRDNERVPSLKEICGINCDSIEDYKMKTSSMFYLLKSEIRFPLYGDFGGLVFYDGGAVFIKDQPIADHYRDTAGFGARYITPIGAFTLELGFKLDKKRLSPTQVDESPFVAHISMGSF